MPARSADTLVTTTRPLLTDGVSRSQLRAQLEAGRWRRAGHAIVLHNGPLSAAQRRRVVLVHAGPQAMWTAFTAAEMFGLRGWTRDEIHVLAPSGTRMRRDCPLPYRLHLHGARTPVRHRRLAAETLPDSLLRAAGSLDHARPACGILAAGVQQRLVTAEELADRLASNTRLRHRQHLISAVIDIGGGSQALSEIDFVRLCRRHGIGEPMRQSIRREPSGRRRYLDAVWHRADGRTVVVEVDGALHLAVQRWWDDQLRQNEIALTDAVVLRYPSVVVRIEERLVVDQLRRALDPR